MKTLSALPLALWATAFLLSGCTGDPAPAAAPASSSSQSPEQELAGTPCDDFAGPDGAKNKVVVRGKTDCAEAAQVLKDYFQKLTPAEAASPQGPGPIVVGAWTCGAGPNDPVTNCSTEDDRQLEATRF